MPRPGYQTVLSLGLEVCANIEMINLYTLVLCHYNGHLCQCYIHVRYGACVISVRVRVNIANARSMLPIGIVQLYCTVTITCAETWPATTLYDIMWA